MYSKNAPDGIPIGAAAAAGTSPGAVPRPARPLFRLMVPVVLATVLTLLLLAACAREVPPPSRTFHSNIAYLEAVTRSTEAPDPQMIFILMGQYLNANRQDTGIAFFSQYLKKHDAALSPPRKSLYLAALALLRATHAERVPLLSRIGWVRETIAMLERAKELSNDEIFLVRWIAGVVYARLPGFFDQEQAALRELKWCLANMSRAPQPGWAREVYFHLALVYRNLDDEAQAGAYLAKSRYSGYDKPITLTTPFALSAGEGLRFYPRRVREVVPGRVFALSGFEFTEFYFIISADRKELIAIDAGTRPDSAEAAYRALKERVGDLPPLTTVFVTHAHWDHIGGHGYFRGLNPAVKFYANANYGEELRRVIDAPAVTGYFFGSGFKRAFVADFKPEVTISARREVRVGGTRFELIPVPGGETNDGMFINMPREGLLFVGDFIMPYLGAPFLEEGSLTGLFAAIDLADSLNPRVLLHGHEPLTRIYSSTALLNELKPVLGWLRQQVLADITGGKTRAEIHHRNLIPPSVLKMPRLQLPYLVLRENVIDRLYDQTAGYWQPALGGMDHLSARELGGMLSDYLGISPQELAEAAEAMSASGDHELAARALVWARARHPRNERLRAAERTVFLKLKEKYQSLNPFKFIIYSERIGHETPQLPEVRQ